MERWKGVTADAGADVGERRITAALEGGGGEALAVEGKGEGAADARVVERRALRGERDVVGAQDGGGGEFGRWRA